MPSIVGNPRWRRGAAALTAALFLVAVYFSAEAWLLGRLRDTGRQRLAYYVANLENAVAKFEALPFLLALEGRLGDALAGDASAVAAANRYLETAQSHAAGVSQIFLLGVDGRAVVANNWRSAQSLVGNDYAFRPYFRDAIAGGSGYFYGVGVTTGEPGYFLSAPVRRPGCDDCIVGVVVVKVGLETLADEWRRSGDRLTLVDRHGIVFLAAEKDWSYRSLHPLSAEERQRVEQTRQYTGQALPPLAGDFALPDGEGALTRLGGRAYLLHSHAVGRLGWRLMLFDDLTAARSMAAGLSAAAALALALAFSLAVHRRLQHRRAGERRAAATALARVHAELEQRIAERTADLSGKLDALKRTEAILRATRDEAVQAGKLAVLGQMAAGITHELNQPLAALHVLSDNAAALLDLGRLGEARENLELISQTIGRTGRIITQLKSFARKGAAEKAAVPVRDAIQHALLIVESRRREIGASGARIEIQPIADALCVLAETVRIEQVLVNLLRNGLDAMASSPAREPLLIVSAGLVEDRERVRIAVRDHGPGIPEAVLPHLFEPFYTTKPVGEGLGLGLAISLAIIESFGGQLEARNAEGGGAEFAVVLDACAKD